MQTKLFKIIFLFFSLIPITDGQVQLEWAVSVGGPLHDYGKSLAVDGYGNVYTIGQFEGVADFDPNLGTYNLTALGQEDIFIQKLNNNGDLVWAKSIGGTGWDRASSIAVDEVGNVYATGFFSGTVDFDPNIGIHNLSSHGNRDIFILKLDAAGNLLWAKSFGAGDGDIGYSITVDKLGNVYTTGSFRGTVDFDPGVNTFNLTAAWIDDIFILKLDAAGNLLWVKSMDSDQGFSITVDDFGNVYSTGWFVATGDFDPNAGVHNLTAVGGSVDFYIQKLDSNGDLLWAKSIGGTGWEFANAITTDKMGNVYTTGRFQGTVDFDPNSGMTNLVSIGDYDIFIQKLDSLGNLIWAKSMGGTDWDEGNSISVDNKGNVYTTGKFEKTVDFDPSLGVQNLTAIGILGFPDIYIQKLSPNGDLVWARNMEGAGSEYGNSIVVDDLGNIFTTGYLGGTTDFDPSHGVFSLTPVPSNGGYDVFIQKLSQHKILGHIYHDYNSNCIKENNEIGLTGRNLILNPGNIVTTTSPSGYWGIDSLSAGNYSITIDTLGSWLSSCPNTQYFTVVHPDSFTLVPSFGLVSTSPCPAPNISIYAPFLRPGFSNQRVYINVNNGHDGLGIIDSAYIIIELDSLITPNASSIPFIDLGNNQYQINLESIYPGYSINLWLGCHLSVNALIGQTLCMDATLFPVDSCSLDSIANPFPTGINPCNTPYDFSHLVVRSECDNDSIIFVIYNTGDGDMSCYSQVRLFLDGTLIVIDSIQLLSGDTTIFKYPSDGRTWRLEVDQHPLHYGNSQPSSTIELCGNVSNWTPNMVNILPMDDADPNNDVFCGLVTGSYDPNDKTGFPLGIGSTHNILPNQEIEYIVRFQNTGTDTAFTVVIRDTLSTNFDIFSVQSGTASHNYSFKMSGPRVLEWTFNNIMLPDSNINETASHGFVKFNVRQIPNLPNGTVLTNSAAIYFDFNSPIITNTSWHTINENIFSVSIDKVETEKLQIKVYPNPTTGFISINKKDNTEIKILVIDNLGRVLVLKKSEKKITTLDLSKLPSGIYFISISNAMQSMTKKIIKQ